MRDSLTPRLRIKIYSKWPIDQAALATTQGVHRLGLLLKGPFLLEIDYPDILLSAFWLVTLPLVLELLH